jgi:hypothetical protein
MTLFTSNAPRRTAGSYFNMYDQSFLIIRILYGYSLSSRAVSVGHFVSLVFVSFKSAMNRPDDGGSTHL